MASLVFLLLGSTCSSYASSLVWQKQLDGKDCVPKYAVRLPVFGPAGSVPRVDASAHRNLTVSMEEIDQAVLPQGSNNPCHIKFRKTRVWAYGTTDSNTGEELAPANWPAVTIVARRGVATRVKYVNQLPSFDPSDRFGPGLVQGVLPVDQTIHWADPLKKGCGMKSMRDSGSESSSGRDQPIDSASATHVELASYSAGHAMPSATGSSMQSSAESAMESNQDYAPPCRRQYIGPVPAVVHLHGGEIPAAYDGDPEAWFTPNGLKGADYHTIGNPGPGKAIYEYANSQEPGTLWFHDHALGITRLNVYAGLAGFYFLKDAEKEPRGYPGGAHEIELAVQDRMFDTNSQLYFPQQQPNFKHPFWSPEFEGDVATVNGAAFPYLNVEPRRYRFRILNGSDNRGYAFSFGDAPVYQIGSDDNYFDKPILLNPADGLPLSPGERADIIVDFSNFAGQDIVLGNKRGGMTVQLPDIMKFRVGSAVKTPEASCDPAKPDSSTGLCARKDPFVRLTDGKGHVLPWVKVDRVRQLTLFDYVLPAKTGNTPIDIKEFANNTTWNGLDSPSIARDFPDDGISELPRVGSIEEWDIVYLSTMSNADHPVHLHLSQFQVLNRENFDAATYLEDWNKAFGARGSSRAPLLPGCTAGTYCLDYGPPLDYLKPNDDGALGGNLAFSSYIPKDSTVMPPRAGESGWKDTADAFGEQVLRILVRWTPSDVPLIPYRSYSGKNWYDFDPTEGYYVWHCHVLNHEDSEMMRPYRVTK